LVEGSGFLRNFAPSGTQAKSLTTVKFGANSVIDLQIIDDETMELKAPPGFVGPVSVSIKNPNGAFVCSRCFDYFDELSVEGLAPRQGPLAGGTPVVITGSGFTEDTLVLFGDVSCPTVSMRSSTELEVVAPAMQQPGAVDVFVFNENGAIRLRRSFAYGEVPRIVSASPAAGPVSGGTALVLQGTGLASTSSVSFGLNPATSITVVSDTELNVTVPAGTTAGPVDVAVATPFGRAVRRGGYSYFVAGGTFAVFAVTPHVARPGETVVLTGQALDVGSLTISVGGNAATVGSRSFATAEFVIPARANATRRSDVLVSSVTSASLPDGFTWRLDATSVAPAQGPQAGGAALTVTGSAFPPAAEVRVGALVATLLPGGTEDKLDVTTPRLGGGVPSDVRVVDSADEENWDLLPRAYEAIETLALRRVQPERGAIAGGTLVTVLGSGFGEGTIVSFGENKAKDIKVIDSHTLSCRTPKATPGVVDVRVDRLGDNDTLAGGFSYFDPRSVAGGLSGGPLVGTLNVTVLDSTYGAYGAPVPLASVTLGLDSSTPLQGTTDQRGQITFSDLSLVKSQTVTATKAGYEATSVTSVASENLTVFISRTSGGDGSPGVPPAGPPPSIISGRVTGFKSPRPLVAGELLEARVFVAQGSVFAGPPFGGIPDRSRETWRLTKDGADYVLYSGAGRRAVYAILGIFNPSTTVFTPVAMGVKRGIAASPEVPAEGNDVIIDTELDRTVPVTVDFPLTFVGPSGPAPGTNSIYAWLDLGAEGLIPNPNNWSSGTNWVTSVSSATASLVFPNFPDLDGSNFIFLNSSAGAESYPASYAFRRQAGDLTKGVVIGPMLPAPRITAPLEQFTGTISWEVDPGGIPDIHQLQILRQTPFGQIPIWTMFLPGAERQVVLPQATVDKMRSEEAGNQLTLSILSTRSPKFSYGSWTYDSLGGDSWSSFTFSLSAGFTP
jgi:hypothetical protein